MLLVRNVFYAMIFFLLWVLKDEIRVNKISQQKDRKITLETNKVLMTKKIEKILSFIVIVSVFLLIIGWLGLIISTALFLGFTMYFLGIKNKIILIILPLVTVILIYLFFHIWLLIPLPTGIFGI